MMLALGAAASAIDGLFGLIAPKQTQQTGSGHEQPNLFAFQADAGTNATGPSAGPAAGGGAQISPETMSALLAAQSQSGTTFAPMKRGEALKDLFAQIDRSVGQLERARFVFCFVKQIVDFAQQLVGEHKDGFGAFGDHATA